MEQSLKELIQNNDHKKILQLPSPEYDKYKVIAAIHLEKYQEALCFASKNSFEQAYIYYRMKNYKKSLKILRKLKGVNVEILKSQCLYFLGYFYDSYKILEPLGNTDEFAVNLSAIQSMNHLNIYNDKSLSPTIFSVKEEHNAITANSKKYKFNDPECYIESEFNRVYKYLLDQNEYMDILKKMNEIHKMENSCFKKQILNLTSDNSAKFTLREREIFDFNLGKTNKISNPVFFQNNFINDNNITDYKIFKDFQNNKEDYYKYIKKFEPFSERLKLLKALIISRRKSTDKRKEKITKIIENCRNSFVKEILNLFGKDISEEEFTKLGMNIILKRK